MNRYYIGLATTLHDPAIAIVNPAGEVVFAEATERYLQNKRALHCEPDTLFYLTELISEYCQPNAEFIIARTWSKRDTRMSWWSLLLNSLGLQLPNLASRYTSDEISQHLLLPTYQLYHLALAGQSSHIKAGANLAFILRKHFYNRKTQVRDFDHHLTHAATACFTSPFVQATCVIVDGYGGIGTISAQHYQAGIITPFYRAKGPESLGAIWMLITELCGFSALAGEEWKVMGLASYGQYEPTLAHLLRSLVQIEGYCLRYPKLVDLRQTIKALQKYRRAAGQPADTVANLAQTWQTVFSEMMTQLLNAIQQETQQTYLTLGGGCALNSAYIGQIVERTRFQKVYVPCAPADDGNAIGAALLAYQQDHPGYRPALQLHNPYLGANINAKTLERLINYGNIQKVIELKGDFSIIAELLATGVIVGWVQDRAEFGPRALGNRSILADPRATDMQDKINTSVKFREEFRPFAPAILHEFGDEYFENYQESPYMERTLRFRQSVRERVPAVVHVDGTGRLQTVKKEWNPKFYQLIQQFHKLTGVPILLNTSFNVMGKPIIHSVEDAAAVFLTTGMGALVIEDYLLIK